MTFCSGAQPLRAPPLTAHRTAAPDSVRALSLLCSDADAAALSLRYLSRHPFDLIACAKPPCRSRALSWVFSSRAGRFTFTHNCKHVGWQLSANPYKRKFIMKRIVVAGLLVGLGFVASNVALAQAGDSTKKDANGMGMNSMPMKSMDMKSMDMKGMDKNQDVAATTHQGVGVVKSVDAKDAVITIAHEPIKSLSWPAMTMGFKVKDKRLVEKIKAGDKVAFTFVQAGNDYVVTAIR